MPNRGIKIRPSDFGDDDSPITMIKKLRVRSGHYTQVARKQATFILRMNKFLTVLVLSLSVTIAFMPTLFNFSGIKFWITLLSFSVTLFSILQILLFDAVAATKLLSVSHTFHTFKEKVKFTIIRIQEEEWESTKQLEEYQSLLEEYTEIRTQHVQHLSQHYSYYRLIPGKLK